MNLEKILNEIDRAAKKSNDTDNPIISSLELQHEIRKIIRAAEQHFSKTKQSV